MNLGKYRLGRHEHDCAVARFAGNDVFFRDVVDVLPDVQPELLLCRCAFDIVRIGRQHTMIVFERKFRIDGHQPRRFRQPQHAVNARAGRKRILHLERGIRQHIAHQRFELHFAESAARSLVAEQLLQADHAAGQRFDLLLRLVDCRETRHDVGESLVGLLKTLVEPLADLAADLLQPRVDFPGQRLRGFSHFFEHRFAALAEVLGQRKPQRMQRVARLLKLFASRTSQAFGVVGKDSGKAIALLGEAIMQIDQHRAMALFKDFGLARFRLVQRPRLRRHPYDQHDERADHQ